MVFCRGPWLINRDLTWTRTKLGHIVEEFEDSSNQHWGSELPPISLERKGGGAGGLAWACFLLHGAMVTHISPQHIEEVNLWKGCTGRFRLAVLVRCLNLRRLGIPVSRELYSLEGACERRDFDRYNWYSEDSSSDGRGGDGWTGEALTHTPLRTVSLSSCCIMRQRSV